MHTAVLRKEHMLKVPLLAKNKQRKKLRGGGGKFSPHPPHSVTLFMVFSD